MTILRNIIRKTNKLKGINNVPYSRFCQDNKIAKCYHDVNIKNLKPLERGIAIKFLTSAFPLKLTGEPGTGKTYFMMALIRELLENKRIHRGMLRFINAMDLDERVDEEFKKYGVATYFIQCLKEDYFLFIDDFGIERSKERAERNYYSLLDDRLANQKPTVISTNLNEEEILNNYGARIHSRLKQCIGLQILGPDNRKPPQI